MLCQLEVLNCYGLENLRFNINQLVLNRHSLENDALVVLNRYSMEIAGLTFGFYSKGKILTFGFLSKKKRRKQKKSNFYIAMNILHFSEVASYKIILLYLIS